MRDAQLVRRIQAGDRRAADALIERYYTDVLRYCARHTDCTQTAEDLTQEVFLHLFRTIGSYREQGQFRAYLYRIAYCLCVDAARQRKADPLPEDLADPAAPFEAIENRDLAQRLLAGLSPEQREAILLRYGQGLKYREIAAVTGQPLRTVQSRVRKALKTLPTKMRRAAAGNPGAAAHRVLGLSLAGMALHRCADMGRPGGGGRAVFPGGGRAKRPGVLAAAAGAASGGGVSAGPVCWSALRHG